MLKTSAGSKRSQARLSIVCDRYARSHNEREEVVAWQQRRQDSRV